MTQRTIASPRAQAKLLQLAGAPGVVAVMIEATDLSSDSAKPRSAGTRSSPASRGARPRRWR